MNRKQTINLISFIAIFFVALFSFAPKVYALNSVFQVLSDTSSGYGATVAQIWRAMMNLVNSLVLLALIAVAFANILRYQLDSYAVKKFLPTFIMAVILANFSFLIARIIIDFGNIAMSLFLFGDTENNITGAFDTLIGKDPTGPKGYTGNYVGYILGYTFKQLMVIVGAILVLILSFIFLIRNYLIYFLVAIAPLGFMAMVLPMTKKYFQTWWSNFTKWVFMPVISLFWLWLAGQFMTVVETSSTGGPWFMTLAFAGLCFYMAITSPFKVGGAVMGAWANYGKKAWGYTGGAAWKATGGAVGKTIKDNTGAYYMRQKEGLKERWYATKTGQWQRRRQEAFKLRNEIPGMVREDATGTARKENALAIIAQPKTPEIVRKRLRASILRKQVKDQIANDSRLITGDVDIIRTMIPGENRVDPNTGQSYFHAYNPMDPNEAKKFKDVDAKMDALAGMERIKQISRGTRASPDQRTKAQGFITSTRINQVATKDLKPTEVSNILTVDSSGLGASEVAAENLSERGRAVPPGPRTAEQNAEALRQEFGGRATARGATAGAQPVAGTVQAVMPDMRELIAALREFEEKIGGAGSLGGEGGLDRLVAEIGKMKGEITPQSLGLMIGKLGRVGVSLEEVKPDAWNRLVAASKQAKAATEGRERNVASQQLQLMKVIARQTAQSGKGASPQQIIQNIQNIRDSAGLGEQLVEGEAGENIGRE